MTDRYWLVHPNGGWQLIDPRYFDLELVADQARRTGGRLIVENDLHLLAPASEPGTSDEVEVEVEVEVEIAVEPARAPSSAENRPPRRFEPPISALAPLFRSRLDRVYSCRQSFDLEINTRYHAPTDFVAWRNRLKIADFPDFG